MGRLSTTECTYLPTLAWIKPSKKDMAVTFSYSPLEY